MVVWNEQYATGSRFIDQQHQVLIDNINHLEGMLTNTNLTRDDFGFLIHLVDFLEFYADSHFKYEEQCMKRYRCPAHAQNKLAHAQFMVFFRHFKQRCEAEGFRLEIIRELHQKMNSWIHDHLLEVDTQLKPCIKG